MKGSNKRALRKLPTGISSLDKILSGGFPELSINIIAGPPGSGKTIFVQQAMYANATPERKALYLTTLSEPSLKMLYYLQKFSFFDQNKVGQEVIYLDIGEVIREKGLRNANAVILKHVQDYKPAMIGIDSFKAIHDMARDPVEVRKFGFDLSVRLTTWAVTAFFIGEYTQREVEEEPIFAIADGIMCMHYQQYGLSYQRFIDVLKLRGEEYFTGKHPFTINNDGLCVYPRIKTPEIHPNYEVALDHVPTGLDALDGMLQGGIPRGTATMVAGAAGTGKTLLGLHFLTAGAQAGEPGVIVTFQENPAQLREISRSFGWDLHAMEEQGMLIHLYHSPVEIQPDIHAEHVRQAVEKIGAKRVLIDSIKDIEIATPDKVRFKDYIYSIVNNFKIQGVTTILTSEIAELFGSFQLSEFGVSFITDNVILLRYLEIAGRMERSFNVLKVRGSQHSNETRRFIINQKGICILEAIHLISQSDTVDLVHHSEHSGYRERTSYDSLATEQMLSLRKQYILSILKVMDAVTIQELARATGLAYDSLTIDLAHLQASGEVEITQRNGETVYSASSPLSTSDIPLIS